MAGQREPPDPSPMHLALVSSADRARQDRQRRREARAAEVAARRARIAELRFQRFLTDREIAQVLTQSGIPTNTMQVTRDMRALRAQERDAVERFDIVTYYAETLAVYRGIEAMAMRDYQLTSTKETAAAFSRSGNLRLALMARAEQTRLLAAAGEVNPVRYAAAMRSHRSADDPNTVSGDQIVALLQGVGLTLDAELTPPGDRRSA